MTASDFVVNYDAGVTVGAYHPEKEQEAKLGDWSLRTG